MMFILNFLKSKAGLILVGLAGGALLIAGIWFLWNWQGDRYYAKGIADEKLVSAALSAEKQAEYRRIEKAKQAEWDETYARLTKDRGAALAAAATADTANLSLRDEIDAQRARAAEVAKSAGRSERAATAAWDVLQECRAEYTALAKEAERVLGIAWTMQEYGRIVSKSH